VPFTGSHPAAVLPLLGTPLPASALVVGSVAPDLPYYLPLPSGPTHSALGVVTVDLLLGAAAWVLWHGVLAAPALAAAPRVVRERLVHRVEPGLRSRLASPVPVLLVLLGLVVGAATHVGWDEFSHAGRWGTQHVPLLAATWGGLPGYRWAQYASGLLGAGALLAWLVREWRRTRPVPAPAGRHSGWVWGALAGAGVVAGVPAALSADDDRAAAFSGATQGGRAVLVLAAVLALAWHLARLRRA